MNIRYVCELTAMTTNDYDSRNTGNIILFMSQSTFDVECSDALVSRFDKRHFSFHLHPLYLFFSAFTVHPPLYLSLSPSLSSSI